MKKIVLLIPALLLSVANNSYSLNSTGSAKINSPTAYVFDSGVGGVRSCEITENGNLSNCNDTSYYDATNPFIFSMAFQNNYLYIPNNYNATIDFCKTDFGKLSDCKSSPKINPTTSGIAIYNKHAYISTQKAVGVCPINPDGNITGCKNTGDGFTFDNPTGIFIYNGRAYIAHMNSSQNDKVTSCQIDAKSNELINCKDTGDGFGAPSGITANNGYVYTTSFHENKVRSCKVESDDTLTNCKDTGDGFQDASGIAIYNNYAYVASQNTIRSCKVESDGTLTNCKNTGDGFDSAFSITISEQK